MNSGLSDPNNHVPEVTPEDGWDDNEQDSSTGTPAGTVLPGRKKTTPRSVKTVDDSQETGLRIDSTPSQPDASQGPHRLEVQEIAPEVYRLEQEPAKPARIQGKITFQERSVRDADSMEEAKEWGRSSLQPVKWIIGAGAVIIVLILLGLWSRSLLHTETQKTVDLAAAASEEQDEANFNDLLFRQAEAVQIFKSYARAVHVDGILPIVRDGKAIKDVLAAHWKPIATSSQWSPAIDSRWLISDYKGQRCGILETEYPDHSKAKIYFVLSGQKLLLDWKATTGFGTASFADLGKGEGDASEIRGVISQTDYYGAIFPEPDYQSYRLVSPDGEETIWCYVRRNSDGWTKLSEVFQGGEIIRDSLSERQVTLRLTRGPEGSQPNQWLIGEMLHIDWAAP